MVAIKGHFDGKVIVPDEPVDLPRNQKLIIHVEAVGGDQSTVVRGVKGSSLFEFGGTIDRGDLDRISKAIEEDCEQVDLDGW